MPHDVIISYATIDKPIADAVCAKLEECGIRCWIAPRDILAGMDYAEAIISAIDSAKIMVLIFSSNANLSKHVIREAERAVHDGYPIIPVRIEDVEPNPSLQYYISAQHWLDALTPPLEQHILKLAETVIFLLGMPTRVVQEVPPQPAAHAQVVQRGPPSTPVPPITPYSTPRTPSPSTRLGQLTYFLFPLGESIDYKQPIKKWKVIAVSLVFGIMALWSLELVISGGQHLNIYYTDYSPPLGYTCIFLGITIDVVIGLILFDFYRLRMRRFYLYTFLYLFLLSTVYLYIVSLFSPSYATPLWAYILAISLFWGIPLAFPSVITLHFIRKYGTKIIFKGN